MRTRQARDSANGMLPCTVCCVNALISSVTPKCSAMSGNVSSWVIVPSRSKMNCVIFWFTSSPFRPSCVVNIFVSQLFILSKWIKNFSPCFHYLKISIPRMRFKESLHIPISMNNSNLIKSNSIDRMLQEIGKI